MPRVQFHTHQIGNPYNLLTFLDEPTIDNKFSKCLIFFSCRTVIHTKVILPCPSTSIYCILGSSVANQIQLLISIHICVVPYPSDWKSPQSLHTSCAPPSINNSTSASLFLAYNGHAWKIIHSCPFASIYSYSPFVSG